MRVDGAANRELIQQTGERPDLVADAAKPQRLGGITTPHGCRNARMGPDQTFPFLRPTESASAPAPADETHRVGAAQRWSSAVPTLSRPRAARTTESVLAVDPSDSTVSTHGPAVRAAGH